MRPLLFVDFDGTIRYNKNDPDGFVNSPEDVALFDDVEAILWEQRAFGYMIFGVTNQGGVAFGYKSELDAKEEIEVTRGMFMDDPFHEVFYCPHHPKGTIKEYAFECPDRKPGTGMFTAAMNLCASRRILVDTELSIMVGDRREDEAFAENAGLIYRPPDQFFGRGVFQE